MSLKQIHINLGDTQDKCDHAKMTRTSEEVAQQEDVVYVILYVIFGIVHKMCQLFVGACKKRWTCFKFCKFLIASVCVSLLWKFASLYF